MADPNRTPDGDVPATRATPPLETEPGDQVAEPETRTARLATSPEPAEGPAPARTAAMPEQPAESAPATVQAPVAESAPATVQAPVAESAPATVQAPVAESAPAHPVPVPPVAAQPVLEPADPTVPAPRRGGNRLVGTAWVLLAAGLFQAGYLAALSLLTALFNGPATVGPQLAYLARTPLVWLPVLFFFLLFELTVLLFNRAGRFAYVVGSLIVSVLTYLVSVLLVLLMASGSIGDTATLLRALLDPEFVLIGLVAREVMLWTGFAIGARGTRVRKRNRAARDTYRQQLAERSDAGA